MGSGKRIEWLDVARGLGIVLVVLGHAAIHPSVKSALYAFHMPLFFLLAGRTFNPTRHLYDIRGLARGRFRRLVVPYLVCAPLFYAWWYVVARHHGEDAARAVPATTPLLGLLYANGTGDWLLPNVVLWFLPALFVAELALGVALRVARGSRDPALGPPVAREIAAVSALALLGYGIGRYIFLPWSVDVALVVLPFLYAGVALGRADRGG